MQFKIEIMAKRLYKSKEDKESQVIIDDRHEILGLYTSQCANCKHFEEWDYFCAAYPNGIPDNLLSGKEKHNKKRTDQEGNITYKAISNRSLL